MKNFKENQLLMVITGALLGFLILMQTRSFNDVSDVINRNTRSDVFREIQVLKKTNEGLQSEVTDLISQLNKLGNNQEALAGVEEQIEKYKLLAGHQDVTGPGITLKIRGSIKALWLIDIVNELFSAGAEGISINGIRITDKAVGFDVIPNGQIMINSVILDTHYTLEAIGERTVLVNALTQPQGILDRMKQLNDVEVILEQKDLITLKVL